MPSYISLKVGDDIDCVIYGALLVGTEKGTLYLDANNNGDFTDDSVLKLSVYKSGRASGFRTDPVPLALKYFDGSERTIRACVYVLERRGYRSFTFDLTEHLEGHFNIGKKNVLVGLYDGTTSRNMPNGCFNNYGVDRFRIDLNGDGKLDPTSEDFLLSKIFHYNDKLWRLDVDSAGVDVRISPSKLVAGRIRLEGAYTEGSTVEQGLLRVGSTGGYSFACPLRVKGSLVVPEGKYRIASDNVIVVGKDKKKWRTSFACRNVLEVGPGRETALTIGAPFKVTPKIYGAVKPGNRISVIHELSGAADEVYGMVGPESRSLAPRVSITDARGVIAAEGKMEFG